MVTMTGTFAPIGVPSALAGNVRSPRSFTPSDIGMARSLMVVVCVYCAGRGCQVLAVAVLVAASAGVTASGAATRAPAATAASSTRTSGRDDIEVPPVAVAGCNDRRWNRLQLVTRVTGAGVSHASQESRPGRPGTALV